MDVSSSLTGPKEFRIVKRGYDPDEVDAFLDQIALGVSELKRKLAEAADSAAAAPPAAAVEDSGRADEIHRALILAQRAADEEVRKATEEAEAIRADAQAAADDTRIQSEASVAEARAGVEEEVARRREEGRVGLLGEINELEAVRDSLAGDVVVLERHVDEQREVVQAAIGELQSLLDHPEAFRIAAASGVDVATDLTAGPATPRGSDEGRDDDDGGPGPRAGPEPEGPVDDGPPAAPPPHEPVHRDEAPVAGTPAPEAPDPAPSPAGGPEAAAAPAPEAPDIDLTSDGPSDPVDVGSPTEAVAPVGGPDSEDAFLAELRKAMLDDEPLGPRDTATPPPGSSEEDDEPARGRSRFGRRR